MVVPYPLHFIKIDSAFEIFPLYSRGNSGFFQECVYLYYNLYSIQGQEEILKIVCFENVTALSLFKLPVGLFREHD